MSTPAELTRDDIAKIFKRDDIRGVWPDELNSECVYLAGRCFAEMNMTDGDNIFVAGHDARTGSYELLTALCCGIESVGCKVESLGLCSSEQVYYMAAVHADRYKGGIMITASHNPAEYNGIKFVHAGGIPVSAPELAELRERMGNALMNRNRADVQKEFAQYMFDLSEMSAMKPFKGKPLKVIVAAGHGVGAVAFKEIGKLLKGKNIDIEYLDADPDGRFPNGVPNPLLPAYNERLGEAVRCARAVMGIGFDGDADRAGFVDERGEALIPSQVLALVSGAKLSKLMEKMPQDAVKPVIMRNLCCSHLLQDLYPDNSLVELIDTPVGHGQIKQLMRHSAYANRILAAGEHSGHYFYPEFFSLDSGILTSLYMLKHLMDLYAMGDTLSKELDAWRSRYLWSGEMNYKLPDAVHVKLAMGAIRHFDEGTPRRRLFEIRKDPELGLSRVFEATEPNAAVTAPDVKIEVTDERGGWWAVVRPSGNEPVLRLNIEVWSQGPKVLSSLIARFEEALAVFGAKRI